jgi:hypothetical protein
MPKYTFTFEKETEKSFKRVLSRLEEDEYKIIEDIRPVDDPKSYVKNLETIIEMDSEACLTLRMGLGNTIKIRRERTEEELQKEKEIEERTTIRINVQVPMNDDGTPKI